MDAMRDDMDRRDDARSRDHHHVDREPRGVLYVDCDPRHRAPIVARLQRSTTIRFLAANAPVRTHGINQHVLSGGIGVRGSDTLKVVRFVVAGGFA